MRNVTDVVNFLREHKLKLITAESCTAGLVCSLLADIPGCGTVLEAGFVVYTERAKHQLLGVNLQTIDAFGLTSEEVAREMAKGALEKNQADIAVAVTGTAESDDELNGVVCFAYALQWQGHVKIASETLRFEGTRHEVRTGAAHHVLLSIPDKYQNFVSSPPGK